MLTLDTVLDRTRRLFADRPAIVEDEGSATWGQHFERVTRVSAVLGSLGLRPGDTFGILARNSSRQTELFHAAYWSGVVPVPVNTRLADAEIEFILKDACVSLVFLEHEFLDRTGSRKAIVLDGGDEDALSYKRLIEEIQPVARLQSAPDQTAILLYTGGTTGRPKGVPLTHGNIASNGLQLLAAMSPKPDDVYMHCAPMFHAADLIGTAFTMIGAAHSYIKRFGGDEVLDAIDRHGVSVTMMTPTMMTDLVVSRKKRNKGPSRLRHLVYGSSPANVEQVREFALAFPEVSLQQGYGLTETSPILTMLNPADHRVSFTNVNSKLLRSAGTPLIGVDLLVIDADDRPLGADQVGEILVRGPNVMGGYHRRAEETERSLRGGWFHTGDLGMIDRNGYLYLVDRLKDMIITGGENVYSGEVEAILVQHPAVREAAVVGIPDWRYGEALLAAIVRVEGETITAEEIVLHCRKFVGGYKVPRQVVFLETLPRSAMGKVLKHELKKTLYADGSPATTIDRCE